MSSSYCLKCHKMIWDKYTGLINGTKEIHKNKYTWILFCGNCKLKTENKYTEFDLRYGLNKPKDQIDMIKVKQLINKDLKDNYWNNKKGRSKN